MVHSSLAALAQAAVELSRTPRVKKAALELTDAAANRIRDLLQTRHKVGVTQSVHVCCCSPSCMYTPDMGVHRVHAVA